MATKEQKEEKIEITKGEYFSLLCDSAKLNLLENGGVDNWSWYSDSLYPEDNETLDDLEESTHKFVFG